MIEDQIQEPGDGPYTAVEAKVIRALKNRQIVGCWWCLEDERRFQYGGDSTKLVIPPTSKPYWPAERCEFRGHRIICPRHMKQEADGLLETRVSWP